MRLVRAIAPVLLVAVAAGMACAEDVVKSAVNTVCPIDGKKIDPKIAPITGKTKEGKEVAIGACSADDAAKIAAKPDLYADDAVANKKHVEKAK